jgi:hypothetical protein
VRRVLHNAKRIDILFDSLSRIHFVQTSPVGPDHETDLWRLLMELVPEILKTGEMLIFKRPAVSSTFHGLPYPYSSSRFQKCPDRLLDWFSFGREAVPETTKRAPVLVFICHV